MSKITRRAFLCSSTLTVVAVALPSYPALAQSSDGGILTLLGLSKNGYVSIPSVIGSRDLTPIERLALGRAATEVVRTAPSRAAANATISAMIRMLIKGSARAGIYGLAAAVAIGGVYCLATGENPLDVLMDLTSSAATGGMVRVLIPCSNSDPKVSASGGSYPDSVPYGFYKNQVNATTTLGYRISTYDVVSSTNPALHGLPSDWTWSYTQSLTGGFYRMFWYKNVNIPTGSACGATYINIPMICELDKSLSALDKIKQISSAALDALGISIWGAADKDSGRGSWSGGGFTGGGDGSGGGGGATGYWGSDAAQQKARTSDGKTGFITPLPQAGSWDDPELPIVSTPGRPLTPAPSDPGRQEIAPSTK
ncbi:MAG: hypothetical protein EON55_17770, partial [Alphaproteobacteria bacterium]